MDYLSSLLFSNKDLGQTNNVQSFFDENKKINDFSELLKNHEIQIDTSCISNIAFIKGKEKLILHAVSGIKDQVDIIFSPADGTWLESTLAAKNFFGKINVEKIRKDENTEIIFEDSFKLVGKIISLNYAFVAVLSLEYL